MGRVSKETKKAALASAMRADPDKLDAIASAAGLKSRKTLDKWMAELRESEGAEGTEETPSPGSSRSSSSAPSEDSGGDEAKRQADALIIRAILAFGVNFTTSAVAKMADVDLKNPKLAGVGSLTAEENEQIGMFAPSLTPALSKLLKFIEKHGVAVFGLLFLGLTIPRVVLIAKLGKEAKKSRELLEKLADAKVKDMNRRGNDGAPAPESSPPTPPSKIQTITVEPKEN